MCDAGFPGDDASCASSFSDDIANGRCKAGPGKDAPRAFVPLGHDSGMSTAVFPGDDALRALRAGPASVSHDSVISTAGLAGDDASRALQHEQDRLCW